MKTKRTDLRTIKIYEALIIAFSDLLAEKAFDAITVRELCDRAHTRTATFYNHFSDKYDFFSFMIEEKRNIFMVKSNDVPIDSLEDYYVKKKTNEIYTFS